MNQDIQNVPNNIHNYLPNSSELTVIRSEEKQKRSERIAEPFRTVPKHSEKGRNETQNVPSNSEKQYRTAPSCSDKDVHYTITVREAARIFEEAGVPRTERALTNWCNKNTRGVTRLDCCYRESQHRYYITPQSIDEVIKEERQKALHRGVQNATLFSYDAEQLSERVQNEVQNGYEKLQKRSEENAEPFRTFPNRFEKIRNSTQNFPNNSASYTEKISPEHDNKTERSGTDEPLDNKEKDGLKELQMESYELKVQLEGQKYLIRKFDELVEGERERHEKEKLALVDRLTDARHQIGSLEERLLQIEAPKDAVRAVVTEDRSMERKNPSKKNLYESVTDQDGFMSST